MSLDIIKFKTKVKEYIRFFVCIGPLRTESELSGYIFTKAFKRLDN